MVTIETTADEIRALLELTQRTPLTRAEALFIEALFTRWIAVCEAASTSRAVPAGATSTNGTDQVQSPSNTQR